MSYAPSLTRFGRDEAIPTARTGPGLVSKHFAALDGVRGVAILLVLWCHFCHPLARTGIEGRIREFSYNGYVGVTLFFVLSGFLITRILVQTRDDPGYFRTFYARRSLRIFPLYYGYLALIFLAYKPLGSMLFDKESMDLGRAWWYLTYLQNMEPGTARLNDGGLGHLWSLAIEEQFYLVWPLAVYLVPRRWLLPLCGAGFLASFGYRCSLFLVGGSEYDVYQSTLSRMDALLAGAGVGIIEIEADAWARLARWIKPAAAVSLAVILGLMVTPDGLTVMRPAAATAGWAALAIFFAGVVYWAATDGAGSRILCAPWLRTVGKYSYGIYVLHMLFYPVIARLVPDSTLAGRLAQIALNLATTACLTMGSWYLLEAPFLRLKRAVRYAA